jgi:hypothetical protein
MWRATLWFFSGFVCAGCDHNLNQFVFFAELDWPGRSYLLLALRKTLVGLTACFHAVVDIA